MDPIFDEVEGWLRGTELSGDATDFVACRNVLAAYFRFSDSGQYHLLDAIVAPDITLEVEPSGTRRVGIETIVGGIKAFYSEEPFLRKHFNTNVMIWRVHSTEIVAAATCLHFVIDEPLPQPSMVLTNMSDAQYTFQGDSGRWRLARRRHMTTFPMPS